MASFRSLNEKQKQYRGRKLGALIRSDEEVDEATEPERPGRTKMSEAGPAAQVMDDYKARRFEKEKDLIKRRRRMKAGL